MQVLAREVPGCHVPAHCSRVERVWLM
jgi:hypothetical protein